MEVEFALLADFVQATSDGKLTVVGGNIDTLWAGTEPIQHPVLGFAVKFLLSPAEVGRVHEVEILLINDDGVRITRIPGSLQTQRPEQGLRGRRPGALLTMNFHSLQFPRFGNYQFDIMVNNTSLKQVPLRVAQRQ
ncbi:MAG: hypothetical protein HYZ73_09155 [Elusimicrobia bacterium]|nr:hypothetical protein [Elusimicrobiota bacterium]